MTPTPPTAAEMQAVSVEDIRFGSKAGIADFRFMEFAHKHWPALIAMREELDRLRTSHRECEDQLVYISNFLKKDARDVRGDGQHTIAALVSQEFADLERQLAESRAECERRTIAPESLRDETKAFTSDEQDYIACKVSHDIRCYLRPEHGLNLICWDNRFALKALATIADLEKQLADAGNQRDYAQKDRDLVYECNKLLSEQLTDAQAEIGQIRALLGMRQKGPQ